MRANPWDFAAGLAAHNAREAGREIVNIDIDAPVDSEISLTPSQRYHEKLRQQAIDAGVTVAELMAARRAAAIAAAGGPWRPQAGTMPDRLWRLIAQEPIRAHGQAELAQALGCDRRSVSGYARWLLKHGLLEKRGTRWRERVTYTIKVMP